MKKLIEFLLNGCWHKWETIETLPVTYDGTPIGRAMMCKCTKCGMPKRFNLYDNRYL
jgi:hypothetical protein